MLDRVAPPLLGRDRELAQLRTWLDDAAAGHGRIVLVSGEPGIGKTRLAQEAGELAATRDGAVAWGHCVDTDGAPPFWPWRQVLRALGRADTGTGGTGTGGIDADGSAQDRFRAVDAIAAAVLEQARRRPLLVVLDDVHWCDEASLLALRHLADRAPEASLLLLATLRDPEPGAAAAARALPDLHRAPDAEAVGLGGLGLDDVVRRLAALGATDVAAAQVHDVTGGNPFFVREVARAVVDGTWEPGRAPHTVRDAVRARVDRLDAATRRFVQAGAVVGRRFPLVVVAAMLDVGVPEALGTADAAVASGLLAQVGASELRFAHALTHDAVRAWIPTGALVELHRAAAGALEAHWAGELDEHLAELAWHHLALAPYGEGASARRWALRAPAEAVRGLAFEEGVRLYRAALGVPAPWPGDVARGRVQLDLGRACYLAGDLDGAVAAARAAAAAARA
ncbi:MAG: ATP-binding protein, partial [Pseudonocardia sp.]